MSIKTFTKGAAYFIVFQNAKRANALTEKMYDEICRGLDEANLNKRVTLTVFTGEGNYYSSGNDFSPKEFDPKQAARKDYEIGFSRWVRRLIDHEKILVGLVNGPAMGMSVTTLALMDYVVCSDNSYFHLPFPNIGVCPEAAASSLLPAILGPSKASGMMYFGEKMDAKEALHTGFVAKVFPKDEFVTRAEQLIDQYSTLPQHSLLASKELIRGIEWKTRMRGVAETELDTLRRLFASAETQALMAERFGPKKA